MQPMFSFSNICRMETEGIVPLSAHYLITFRKSLITSQAQEWCVLKPYSFKAIIIEYIAEKVLRACQRMSSQSGPGVTFLHWASSDVRW